MAFTNNSFELAGDQWHNEGSTQLFSCSGTALQHRSLAVRLFPLDRTEKAGVMALLPAKAVVEMLGSSELGIGMVEVAWKDQRFAVFERDLKVRGSLVRTISVGD